MLRIIENVNRNNNNIKCALTKNEHAGENTVLCTSNEIQTHECLVCLIGVYKCMYVKVTVIVISLLVGISKDNFNADKP